MDYCNHSVTGDIEQQYRNNTSESVFFLKYKYSCGHTVQSAKNEMIFGDNSLTTFFIKFSNRLSRKQIITEIT